MKNLSEQYMSMSEAKGIELPNVSFDLMGFGKDSNGNGVAKYQNSKGKGFSIQTNGNLPHTHALRGTKAKDLSPTELTTIADETKKYIEDHGTKTMQESLNEATDDQRKAEKAVGMIVKAMDTIEKQIKNVGKLDDKEIENWFISNSKKAISAKDFMKQFSKFRETYPSLRER